MFQIPNRLRCAAASAPGAGAFPVGAAIATYLTPAGAGMSDGSTLIYYIEDLSIPASAWGVGVYNTAGATITRSPLEVTSTGSPVSFTSLAVLGSAPRFEDVEVWLTPEHFLARGDSVLLTDVAMTAGSKVVSTAHPCTAADIGKLCEVVGAGTSGTVLTSNIASVTAGVATLADAAGTTVSAARCYIGTNDLTALVSFFTALMTFGGRGKLTPGKIYQCDFRGIADGATLVNITNPAPVTFDGLGGKIVGLRDFSIGGNATLYFLRPTNAQDCQLLNVYAEGYQDPSSNFWQRGWSFWAPANNSARTKITGKMVGGRQLAWYLNNSGTAPAGHYDIEVHIETDGCAYPFTAYEAYNITGSIYALGAERSDFLVNCKGVKLQIIDDNAVAQSVLLEIINDTTPTTGLPTNFSENIEISYTGLQRTASTSPGQIIGLFVRSDAAGVGGTNGARLTNATFNFSQDMSGTGGASAGGGLILQRQVGTLAGGYTSDTGPARGHRIENLVLNTSYRGLTGSMAVFTIGQDSGGGNTWPAGEVITCQDPWNIIGTTASGSPSISIDCTAFTTPVTLNIDCAAAILILTNYSKDRVHFGKVNTATYQSSLRSVLFASTSIFVDASLGNDNNFGLASGSSAKATMQAAVDEVQSWDLNGFVASILPAAGTYAPFTVSGRFVGSTGPASVVISGAGSSTIIQATGSSNGILVQGGAQLTLQNMKLTTTASSGAGQAIRSIDPGTYVIRGAGLEFGAWPGGIHINVARNALMQLTGAYTISGGAGSHMQTGTGGTIFAGSTFTGTITGTPNFTAAFLKADLNGAMSGFGSITWSGAATGTQYAITHRSMLDTGNTLSSVPGTASTGTLVDPITSAVTSFAF